MNVRELRGYGVAASDAEGGWDPAFKAKIKKAAFRVVVSRLSSLQKLRVFFRLLREKGRAARLDLSDLRQRGMKNEAFLSQQLEYLSLFSALARVCGKDSALSIMYEIMAATAAEALLRSLPDPDEVRRVGEPFEVFRSFVAVQPEAARKAGCHELTVSLNREQVLEFDIHWCIWLELARKMGVPEACLPNCYADDIAYPDYFRSLGIRYCRTGTLAQGKACCDFRFERE